MGGGDTVCRLYGTPCPADGQRVRMNRLRRGGGQMGTLSRFCDLVPELPEFYAPPLPPSNSLFLPVHVSAISGYISYLLLPPPRSLVKSSPFYVNFIVSFFFSFFLFLSFFQRHRSFLECNNSSKRVPKYFTNPKNRRIEMENIRGGILIFQSEE